MYSREIVDETTSLRRRVPIHASGRRHHGKRHARTIGTEHVARGPYCPRCSEEGLDEEAYAYLLGLYLGDGYIGAISKGVSYLSIACCDTWPGLIEECEKAMARVFPKSVFKVHREGCTEVKATSKHWPCVFPQHGPGRKHERRIVLEPWQRRIVDEHTGPFVRGLIHSDGSRLTNRVRKKLPDGGVRIYAYPRYQFVNVSSDIAGLFTHALDRLDIAWRAHVSRREPRHRNAHIVSISRRDAVARMDDFVGPKY
ncbi:transcriptional regulator [Nocardiopsis alba]|uniref:Transcriptional regulator n=1 Tax=Nocardiopsis alba TaxID=53437 RepID=A0ABV5DS90_9ACTN